MAGFSTEAKVGVFVMVGLALLAYMTLRLGEFSLGQSDGYPIWAVFDQAAGLKKEAPIEMAGIQIGKVSRIALYKGKARVDMLIAPDVQVPLDSSFYIRTRGVLGDKFISVEGGTTGGPALQPDQEAAKAVVPTDLDQVMSQIGDVAKDIGEIARSLRVSVASPESEQNIKRALADLAELSAALKVVVADNQKRLDQIVVNMEQFTGDLSTLTQDNRKALSETIGNFQQASAQMEATMGHLQSVMAKLDSGEGTLGGLISERKTLEDLNATLASLRDVSAQIAEGRGTLGRLVKDETTIDRMDEALAGINDFLGRADAWKVNLSWRGEYLFQHEGMRSTVNVRLQPKADKFYLLGIVSDPIGYRSESVTTTVTDKDGNISTETRDETKVDKDKIMFNAQFGKRFHDLELRAGILQSTGGVGMDYYLWDDNVVLTAEVFDFSSDRNPHIKVGADFRFWKYFFITAGYDDMISDLDNDSFFIGGGIAIYDDDLKFLLTSAPTP